MLKTNAAVQRPASKNSSSKRRPSTGSIKAVSSAALEEGGRGHKASEAPAASVEAPSDDIKLMTVSYVNERVSAEPFRYNTSRILDQMIIRIGRLMKRGVKSKDPSIVSDRCFRKMTSSTHITPDEFKASLSKLLGEEIPETMVLDLFTKVDVDSDGKISPKDFISTFFKDQVLTDGEDGGSSLSTALSPEEHVDHLLSRFREKIDQKLHSSQDRFRHILKLFDNTSERITPHIFRNAAFKAGLVLNEADAIALFKELDSEGEGKLSIHDILRKIEIKIEPANTSTGNFIDNFEQQKSSGPKKVVHSSGPDTQVSDAETALLLARYGSFTATSSI
jgi:Ca2+-binding EF-hand superfamily protein